MWRSNGHKTAEKGRLMDGRSAVVELEKDLSDALITTEREISGRLLKDPTEATAVAAGMAAGGMRTALFLRNEGLRAARQTLGSVTRSRLPLVLHWFAHRGHDDYLLAAETGAAQLFASDVQEAADHAVIARRIAEEALVPVVCAQDENDTALSLQEIRTTSASFAGAASDEISSPTAAQKMLWSERRRRMPALTDIDKPAGLGGRFDRETDFQARAAEAEFFTGSVSSLTDRVFKEFFEAGGRSYGRVDTYRTDDATCVVIAQGSVFGRLKAAVDHVREQEGIRAGVVYLRMYRPFPADLIGKHLSGKGVATVLEQNFERTLLRDVRAAVPDEPYEEASFSEGLYGLGGSVRLTKGRTRLLSGVYAAASFDDLCEVLRNMGPRGRRQEEFYVGARFDRPDVRIPLLERQLQLTRRGYPHLTRKILAGRNGHGKHDLRARAVGIYSTSRDECLFGGGLAARLLFPSNNVFGTPGENRYTVVHGTGELVHPVLDALMLMSAGFLEDRPCRESLSAEGLVVVDTDLDPQNFWFSLSAEAREWVRRRRITIRVVDTRRVAAPEELYARVLRLPALLGAFAFTYLRSASADALLPYLNEAYGSNAVLLDACMAAFKSGAEASVEVEWASYPDRAPEAPEPEAPWSVRRDTPRETLFDVTRFWQTTGFLNKAGERTPLADPFLASRTSPPLTSVVEAEGRLHTELPVIDLAKVTGSPSSWALCPDGAISASLQDASTLVETALAGAERLLHLPRLAPHLAKQIHKIVSEDETGEFSTLGALIGEAFQRVVGRMDVGTEQLEAMRRELETVCTPAAHFPVIKTDRFFRAPEKAEKGLLLSLTVNPDLCTSCGICAAVDGAFTLSSRADRSAMKANDDFMRRLPDVPRERIEPFLSGEDGVLLTLLRRRCSNARVDGGSRGDGRCIALRLVFAAIEWRVENQARALLGRINEVIENLEAEIVRTVGETVQINDLDAFGRQLSAIQDATLDAEGIGRLIANRRSIDRSRLERLSSILTQLRGLQRLYLESNRAGTAAAIDATLAPNYPSNPYSFPWIGLDQAPAVAQGLFEAVMRRMASTFALLRGASNVLTGGDEQTHLSWRDFTDEERAACPPVVAVVEHDSAALRDLLRSDVPIKVVWIDGEPASDAPSWIGSAFMLQGSIGYPAHLVRGLEDGLAFAGPALFRIYASSPEHDDIVPSAVIAQSKAAVDSRAFPLLSYDPRRASDISGRLDIGANPETGVSPALWALREGRFAREFRLIPKRDWGTDLPSVEITGADGNPLRKTYSAEIADLARRSEQAWRTLRELAGEQSTLADRLRSEARAEAEQFIAAERARLEAEFSERAQADEAELNERYQAILSSSLLELSGFGPDELAARLRSYIKGEA